MGGGRSFPLQYLSIMDSSGKTPVLSHFASIFPVQDVQRSIAFYTKQLGFRLEFTWNDPVDYAVLVRGGVSIHLNKRIDPVSPPSPHAKMYVFTENIDVLYEEYLSMDIPIKTPIGTRDYGMRDFDILDPDGYMISFGEGVSES